MRNEVRRAVRAYAKKQGIPKCRICRCREAEWAAQLVGSDTPTFSTLGSHYRGFRVVTVCDECREHATGQIEDMLLHR